jgi:regulator of replication initiation timing
VKSDLQQIRDEMKQNVTETDELRKELQELKRRLGGEGTDSSETPSKKSQPAGSGNR